MSLAEKNLRAFIVLMSLSFLALGIYSAYLAVDSYLIQMFDFVLDFTTYAGYGISLGLIGFFQLRFLGLDLEKAKNMSPYYVLLTLYAGWGFAATFLFGIKIVSPEMRELYFIPMIIFFLVAFLSSFSNFAFDKGELELKIEEDEIEKVKRALPRLLVDEEGELIYPQEEDDLYKAKRL